MSADGIVVLEVDSTRDPTREFAAAWEQGARVLPLARTLPQPAREALVARARDARLEPAAGVLLPTSGSTGTPRLVDLPLASLHASADLGARVIPFGPGDAWHASLAPSHIGGVMILVRALRLGGAVRFGAQPRVWADLAGATHVSLVATQLARLLDDPSPVPGSLKAVMLGGGPSPQALRDAAIRRGIPLFATYGLTETSSQVATVALAAGDAGTLAGPPLPGISITIDPVHGEVLVDGPTLARGLVTDRAFAPLGRPLRTRDTGFLDALGRLHIVGRLDSMFISGGRNIHPETIERALCSIACVRSACVLGVPHAKWGTRPVAFVDLAGAPARPLRDELRATLEPYLVPDAFLAMPADEAASMKPSRARLSARFAAGERFSEVE